MTLELKLKDMNDIGIAVKRLHDVRIAVKRYEIHIMNGIGIGIAVNIYA